MAAAFTIFENQENGTLVSVWDHQLPTQTGIGELAKWVPVHHGKASSMFDRIAQKNKFAEGRADK